MTIHFPDVASYQAGLSFAGAPFVWVKATEGTGYTNPDYWAAKSRAAAAGAKFGAYHALHNGNGVGQADYAFGVVGPGVPLMLDWENFGDNPSVATAQAFITRYRARGGSCRAVYLPRWFWSGNLGGPSLAWFPANGCLLVSSNYTAYSDNGPGWQAYGGWAPTQWQYSDNYRFNGMLVDFNAYRGTISQWWALLTGGSSWVGQVEDDTAWTRTVLGKLVNDNGGWRVNAEINAAVKAAEDAAANVKTVLAAVQALGHAGADPAAVAAGVVEGLKDAGFAAQVAQALAADPTTANQFKATLAAALDGVQVTGKLNATGGAA